jgi:hypothetical protein
VRAAGGVVLDSYPAAEAYCEREAYPPGVLGLIPAAPGTFHDRLTVDGRPIYLPPRTKKGRELTAGGVITVGAGIICTVTDVGYPFFADATLRVHSAHLRYTLVIREDDDVALAAPADQPS